MDPVVSGIIGTLLVFFLLSLGMPIAFSMMLVGFLGISLLSSVEAALPVLARTVYETSVYYPYTVIPLFVVMGGYDAPTLWGLRQMAARASRRSGCGNHRGLRRLCRSVRIIGCHSGGHGNSSHPGNEPVRLQPQTISGHRCGRWHAGIFDTAKHRFRCLRHVDRTVHRKIADRWNCPRAAAGAGLHRCHRVVGEDRSDGRPRQPSNHLLERKGCFPAARVGTADDLFGHDGWHLSGVFYAHGSRRHRCDIAFCGGAN